jgi:hypothetical protein
MMVIDNKYEIGQVVYCCTDKEQQPRMITGIMVRPTAILYVVSLNGNESYFYEIEISNVKDIILTTT